MKKEKILSAIEMLELFKNQWATTKDIMNIGAVGMNKALAIKKELTEKLNLEGKYVDNGLLPMKAVIEYFKIDIDYLEKIAKK
ncbi:MAG: hypothetical protein RRY22_05650 [Bacilli bacterium]